MPATPNTRKPNRAAKPKDRRAKLHRDADPAAAIVADQDRQKAINLRLQGHTFREIAAAVGVSVETAHRYVNDGWERIQTATDEQRQELRDLELARLDAMLKRVLPIATANNLKVEKEVFRNGQAEIICEEDAELQFKAVDRALKIGKRRAELLGLDAPAKIEVTGKRKTVPLEELERRIAEKERAQHN